MKLMKISWFLLFAGISFCHAYDLGRTSQEKYLFAGGTYLAEEGAGEIYYDIFTGDFPLILDIHPGHFSVLSGLPMHRPTPFFFGFGTDTQFGYFDAYNTFNLLQTVSIGVTLDMFGDRSVDKFLTIGSRFGNLSHGFRFYEDTMRFQNALTWSTEGFTLRGETVYGIGEGSLLDWDVTLDVRVDRFLSLRCSVSEGLGVTLAAGISHYDPPLDRAAELEWDYVGAHRGTMMHAPENSEAALLYALERDDITFIETDMNVTSDGEYMAIHDLSFLRYIGMFDSIDELTSGEISRLDMGRWFSSDFAGTRALTMQEVADTLIPFRERGGTLLEVKLIGEGEEAMQQFLDSAREEFSDSTPVSYMTLYYENADLLKEMIREDESWGLAALNFPGLPSFLLGSGFIYPLFEAEMSEIIRRYEPDYIMITSDYMEFADEARALAAETGVDFLFWDFKDTIYGISQDGSDHPWYFD